jgi:hypothetical protein
MPIQPSLAARLLAAAALLTSPIAAVAVPAQSSAYDAVDPMIR